MKNLLTAITFVHMMSRLVEFDYSHQIPGCPTLPLIWQGADEWKK